ncbi:hypothetical protein D3C84_866090 [compost metagenome]
MLDFEHSPIQRFAYPRVSLIYISVRYLRGKFSRNSRFLASELIFSAFLCSFAKYFIVCVFRA